MNELSALIALQLAFPFSPNRVMAFIKEWGSAEALWSQEIAPTSPLYKILEENLWEKELELMHRAGVRCITFKDPEYPSGLKDLPDPPPILHVLGSLEPCDTQAICMVGTRNASIYGKGLAETFGEICALNGVTVISGLARGIDTAAHEGALKGGRTIAVIGSGLGQLYPKENIDLARRIGQKGAVISEYPFSTPPDRFQFPRRNRLIAALSLGCLLVEGAEKSGGMITVDWAIKLKRACFTIPGRIDMETFQGNHSLIKRNKARLVENPTEMLSLLETKQVHVNYLNKNALLGRGVTQGAALANLTSNEAKVIAYFPMGEVSFEELALRSELPVSALNATLSALLLKNIVREFPGKLYKKV